MNIKKLNKLEKRTRIVILIIYAVIMFSAIQIKISMITFIVLFAVLPIVIYFYVKTIFPKNLS